MNQNTRTRHIAETPVGRDVDRPQFFETDGRGSRRSAAYQYGTVGGPGSPAINAKHQAGGIRNETRKLGSLEVSEIGFGDMTLSGGHYGPGVDRAQGIRQIRDAHERGVTLAAVCLAGGTCDTDVLVRPRFRRNARR